MPLLQKLMQFNMLGLFFYKLCQIRILYLQGFADRQMGKTGLDDLQFIFTHLCELISLY